MTNQISVLVCDDSSLMRKFIIGAIEADKNYYVVATAVNGFYALQKIPAVNPDVIILDLEMPQMNGIEFLKERKKRGITIPVIILSSLAKKGAAVTLKAMELGASDFILKPRMSSPDEVNRVSIELRALISVYGNRYRGVSQIDYRDETIFQRTQLSRKNLSEIEKKLTKSLVDLKGRESMRVENSSLMKSPRPHHEKVRIVVIGISTGGPGALRELLPKLPKDFPVPIVIVQHMPEGFTYEFADNLNALCPLSVVEAKAGDLLTAGTVFIAPGNYHLGILKHEAGEIVELEQSESVNGHRPSVEYTYKAVRACYGAACLAILMTGMGRDGAKELGNLYNNGAYTIAQDEKSCIVYGMPRVAIESGYAEFIEPLDTLAERIQSLAK